MEWVNVSKTKDLEIVRAAVDQLDINERDQRGRTPLMLFITNRMPPEAIQMLLDKGAELEAEDKLGDTALKKAVKFKQVEAVKRLLQQGAELDSQHGILATAWNAARNDKAIADLLLETKGAVRLTLSTEEEETVDDILYEESEQKRCQKIKLLDSSVLLHAVVNGYNWDNGPEAMIAAFENPACATITLLDMYEWMDADYWLEMDEEEIAESEERKRWRMLAIQLKEKLADEWDRG
ncbi:DUF4274 domain-containing protein [Brevibacillus brevis]|uniref:DUF4274 domain-containing protein n=1 Tax=Brevibacillus brevis TaxID=1393 RepID=A0A2Z4MI99_BREBE|nr:DUF4274 domain-containing protein [Brevibacillus brevis]AWX56123.1 DUF4274 domain-containing protein [Brevibacillus brevis]